MWSLIDDAPSAVQAMMLVACVLMGLSHILQPRMWAGFFAGLHAQGSAGVVVRTFALELWPALLIVTLHPVIDGIATVITVYGWLLMSKITLSLLAPSIGLRSLAMAERGPGVFVGGGFMLLGVAACAGLALFGIA